MATYKITPAEAEDIPALNRLVNSAYRGEISKKGWTTEADLLDGIRIDETGLGKMMTTPGAVILTYREEDHLAGCVFLHVQEEILYLGMLTVSPDRQGGGIGKRLLSAAEAYAIQHGCASIVMTVITLRESLIDWYKRHGYRDTGERKPFPDDPAYGIPRQPLEFLVLQKELSGI